QTPDTRGGFENAPGRASGPARAPTKPLLPRIVPDLLAGPLASTADLKTVGRIIGAARHVLRARRVDEKFLADAGMDEAELRRFVARYEREFAKVAPVLKLAQPAPVGTVAAKRPPAKELLASQPTGRGSSISAPPSADTDALKSVTEMRRRRVGPRYRDAVEEYFKAMSAP
ncbi:MAG: hypothetical protein QGD94_09825, partial [Planctomycetia bacterium]|nr:hypothetical protein [Planctomycetia bacterium]